MNPRRATRSLFGKREEGTGRVAGKPLVLIRGGGDLGTGVAARLSRCGFAVLVTEVARPLAIRRLVSLAEAVYEGEILIEDLRGLRVNEPGAVAGAIQAGVVPVLVDPEAQCRSLLRPMAVVDARMRKTAPELGPDAAPWVIGLGPGFVAGVDCHAVVETHRGHRMGRAIWAGAAAADTGIPEAVLGVDADRVLRAPASGVILAACTLGVVVQPGDLLARVGDQPLLAPFAGALRGLMHDGLEVRAGDKIGDLDPRGDPSYCLEISDRALAVGGGVLEILLSQAEIRRMLRA